MLLLDAAVAKRSTQSFVGNLQNLAAGLAVNRVQVVPPQAALRTFEAHLVTPKIMMITEIRRPKVPSRVMSPNPVVVRAVTVK